MAKARYPVTPMTLGNMRSLGVRSLAVTCELCHHEAVLPADRWPDAALGARSLVGRRLLNMTDRSRDVSVLRNRHFALPGRRQWRAHLKSEPGST
jgi:hypothetical protein